MKTNSFSKLQVPGESTEVAGRLMIGLDLVCKTPEPPFLSVFALVNSKAVTQGSCYERLDQPITQPGAPD